MTQITRRGDAVRAAFDAICAATRDIHAETRQLHSQFQEKRTYWEALVIQLSAEHRRMRLQLAQLDRQRDDSQRS
jgi:hypothetical protein